MGKVLAQKTARANRKEGDGIGASLPLLSPSFLLARAIFEPNPFLYKYPNISQT